jgi:hypothetical protein
MIPLRQWEAGLSNIKIQRTVPVMLDECIGLLPAADLGR